MSQATVDERLKTETFVSRLMKRPELGAIAGVILVTIFFLITADSAMFTLSGFMNFMSPAAQLGILAIGAAMLMIGGEFDLSIGSMVAFAGLIFAFAVVNVGLPLIVAIPLTLLFAALVGSLNGFVVIKSRLPVLHRHAGRPVHPARPLTGRAESCNGRINPAARRAGGHRRRLPCTALLGQFLSRHLCLARRARVDREFRQWRPQGARHPGRDHLVHPRSPSPRPTSCCGRLPVTGSSLREATQTLHPIPVSPCGG